jgi:hypothetical protein
MKKFVPYFILLMMALIFTGCQKTDLNTLLTHTMTFENKDFSIELPNRFQFANHESYNYLYQDLPHSLMFMATLQNLNAEILAKKYVEQDYLTTLLDEANLQEATLTEQEHGLSYLEFESLVGGKTYQFVLFLSLHKETLWAFQFSCLKKDYPACKDAFLKYASSVQFKN